MKASLFYLPSIGSRREIEQGLAGLRADLYGRMLSEISAQARLADDLGYDSIHFTEHHFHVEGFELSNNPVLLDLFVAMQTRRLRVGQLGIVLPAQNPIRVAEDIAMLDHMSGGRACAGFARGYQRRWVDVMAQQNHGIHGALPHQHDEIDAANREAFEESYRLVKRAWTEPLLQHEGKFWRIPAGPTPWDLEATRRFGAGVADGIVKELAVVPKPLQRPHPPIFQPFASSDRSIRWCAEEGITAVLPPLHPTLETRLFELYAEVSGRPKGDGVAVLRDVVIADSDEEAQQLWHDSGAFVGAAWFAPFGFSAGLADPRTGEAPDLLAESLALVGTVDSVCRQMERLLARLPARWIFAWTYNGLIPHGTLLRSIERFAREVLPRFADGAGASAMHESP
ncbi:MAG TPA: LLM class flavin-dependent oxidoreductase [Myxococcota bacterium]|jgi:alkanesulfonate monooxygenase SsuD/methylene tetrahydromethanopterin reductase-like flavin-dependent oxidoreductase (luciferase family)|nr:LLM class flavin-dependent oxidoreductase [Myxococcota bacterium]